MTTPVIIRVKRKRLDAPIQQLVVASDVDVKKRPSQRMGQGEYLAQQLDQLTTTDQPGARYRKVRFSRVGTSELNDDQALLTTTPEQVEETKQTQPGKRSREEAQLEYIPSGKHRVVDTENGSMVVFDLAPRASRARIEPPALLSKQPAGIRVLNPMERLMDEGITRALEAGNFDGIMEALDRGASISHQRTYSDGRTPLMAAAANNDMRMVAKMLSLGADPEARDTDFRTALDYCEHIPATKNVRDMLYSAMMDRVAKSSRAAAAAAAAEAEGENDEYVYDILRMDPSTGEEGGEDTTQSPATAPFAYIPGLSFQPDGTVELVFDHDEEWSDLADDEDPDSNDERYDGNDYPEDEDEDDDRREAHDSEVDSDLEADVSRMNLPPSALRHLHLGGVMRHTTRSYGDHRDPVEGYDPDEPDDSTEQWQGLIGGRDYGLGMRRFPMDRDLSDDDYEDGYSRHLHDHRPGGDAVAYDPFYDQEHSDDNGDDGGDDNN